MRSSSLFLIAAWLLCTQVQAEVLVIAHRGASGYLPEHTLEAKVLAFAQGADYLEQDLVMSRDGALVVFHDLTLERTTDVAERFPGRAREDGRYYVVDFSMDELRVLRVSEAQVATPAGSAAQYLGRFPPRTSRFTLHTFAEELELIAGLKASTGREVGIYPELKAPWFHHQEGRDLAAAVLQVLKEFGYTTRSRPVYLQSFDFRELLRVRQELLPQLEMDLNLVQLIAENAWRETREPDAEGGWVDSDFDWMRTPGGLARLAEVVDGIGPQYPMLVMPNAAGVMSPAPLASDARVAGLLLHTYTLRTDALPDWVTSYDALMQLLVEDVGVDGVFTDFPDLARVWLQARL